MEKRAYERFITGSRCEIDCATSDKVKIKDLSISGVCLETARRINITSIYSMNFVDKEIGGKTLKGKVVWSTLRRSIKDNVDIIPIYHIGLKFIEQNDGHTYLEKLTEGLSH